MPTQAFWDGSRRHELLIRRCPRCGANLHPRRLICPACGSEELSWIAASGRGVVYSVSTIYRAASNARQTVPYHVGIVALDEGVHLFTRFTDDGGPPDIDDRVAVRFERQSYERELPVFAREAT